MSSARLETCARSGEPRSVLALLCAATGIAFAFCLPATAEQAGRTTITESYHTETLIDASIEEVWPHALDIKSWMTAHQLVTVSGTPNTEGEVVKVIPRKTDPAAPKEHFHFYTITKVIPNKQVVLKVYSAEGGSYGTDMLIFDAVTLYEDGGKTRVVFDMNGDVTGPRMSAAQIRKKHEETDKYASDMFKTYWENLRQLVAKGRSAGS